MLCVCAIQHIQHKDGDRASWQKTTTKLTYVSVGRSCCMRQPTARSGEAEQKHKQRKMKRIGNLFERIASIDNLRAAERNARKGKRNTYGVRLFDRNAEANLVRLHDMLMDGTFRTSQYSIFKVYKPKERDIYRLPYYPDRIVHHAIMRVMEPIWTRTLTHNTYSCIKGRGIEACRKDVRRFLDSHASERMYCLKTDIRKFYPSIDHGVLKRVLRRKVKDRRLLALMDEIVDSAPGLPIGNYLSQYWANLYLSYMMHDINERQKVKAFEYADDIVFFSRDKRVLHGMKVFAEKYMSERLHIEMKGNWQVFPIATDRYSHDGRAVDYVGYQFYMRHTLLRKSIKKAMLRKAARLRRRKTAVTEKERRIALSPWTGWAEHCDSRKLMRVAKI